MRWTICMALLLVVAATSGAELLVVEEREQRFYAGQGYMEFFDDVVFMHLKGSAFEMGLQHGTFLAHMTPDSSLQEMGDQFNPLMAEASGFEAVVQAFRSFYFRYKMYPMIRRNIPESIYQELEGIIYGVSQGHEVDPLPIVAGNLGQDLAMTFGCTSAALFGTVTHDGSLYHARNLDHIGMVDWAQFGYVAVYEPEEGFPFITHIYPIHAGTMQAMNNQGISISVNYSLGESSDTSLDGVSIVFLLRHIVQFAQHLDEAVEMVKNLPRTFGMNILISDGKIPDAVVIEVDANRYAVREAEANAAFTANRFNSEFMQQFQQAGWMSSWRREEQILEHIETYFGAADEKSMAELLRQRAVPGSLGECGLLEGINNAGTILSSIFSPSEQMMWVGIMSPQRTSADNVLRAFSLEEVLAGGSAAVPARDIAATIADPAFESWSLVRQAALAYAVGDVAEGLAYLDRVSGEYQNAEAVVSMRAKGLMRLGEFSQAAELYRQLVDRPQLAEPFYRLEALAILGAWNDTLGQRNEAVEYYAQALDVFVPDLGGDSSLYRQIAQVGLERPVYIEFTGSNYSFSNRENPLWQFVRAPAARSIDWSSPYAAYEGATVETVRVLGAHATNAQKVKDLIGVKPGDVVSPASLHAGQRRIQGLNAVELAQIYVIPVGADTVDVIVRLGEGFGWYLDPVQFVIEHLVNLASQTVRVRYYNLGGTLVSIGGEYSFGASERFGVDVTFPLLSQPTTVAYQRWQDGQSIEWGTYAGSSYSMTHESVSVRSSVPLGSHSSLQLSGRRQVSEVTDLVSASSLGVDGGQYWSFGLGLDLGWPGSTSLTTMGTRLLASASLLTTEDFSERYPRVRLQGRSVGYLGAGLTARLALDAAWTAPDTPFEHQLRLGGNGQLGTPSPTFIGEKYALADLELQRYFTEELYVFASGQTALVWEDGSSWAVTLPLLGASVGVGYKTPIGLTVEGRYSYNVNPGGFDSFTVGVATKF